MAEGRRSAGRNFYSFFTTSTTPPYSAALLWSKRTSIGLPSVRLGTPLARKLSELEVYGVLRDEQG